VILPKLNEPDLDEVPKEVRRELEIHLVSRVDEALEFALEQAPQANEAEAQPAMPM
jgi:ATP-dependent Lon protease